LKQENASLHSTVREFSFVRVATGGTHHCALLTTTVVVWQVHELRTRLQNAEPMDGELSGHEEILSLRKQLLKAKRDKDKALKLVIQLVGKVRAPRCTTQYD
jgi:hypothetical protein